MAEPQPSENATSKPARAELRPGYLAVGVVMTSFGLRGEMKVESLTAFSERFARGARLWFAGAERTVERGRWNERGVVVLKLSGIETPEDVARLRGEYLQVPESQRPPLPEGEYYRDDLLDLSVRTSAGRDLGVVAELLPTGANDVLLVRGADGEFLIPLVDDVVSAIDLPHRLITIEAVPGLLAGDDTQPEQREEMSEPSAARRRKKRSRRGSEEPRPGPEV